MSFFTDHQVGDTRVPWTAAPGAPTTASRSPRSTRARSNGGGNETAATHGAIYYAALAPAYLLASSSPLSQLTLMRLDLGADRRADGRVRVPARARARARPALAGGARGAARRLPADVRVHLGRGQQRRRRQRRRGGAGAAADHDAAPRRDARACGLLTGGAADRAADRQGHRATRSTRSRRSRCSRRCGATTAAPTPLGWAALAARRWRARELSTRSRTSFTRAAPRRRRGAGRGRRSAAGAVSEALAHPLGYLAYLWQVFLPRLPFMAPHFPGRHDFPGS